MFCLNSVYLQHKDYKLRDAKPGGFVDKAAELGVRVSQLHARVKTLKDNAVSAMRQGSSGSAPKKLRPLQEFAKEHFGFLVAGVVHRPSRAARDTIAVSDVICCVFFYYPAIEHN